MTEQTHRIALTARAIAARVYTQSHAHREK